MGEPCVGPTANLEIHPILGTITSSAADQDLELPDGRSHGEATETSLVRHRRSSSNLELEHDHPADQPVPVAASVSNDSNSRTLRSPYQTEDHLQPFLGDSASPPPSAGFLAPSALVTGGYLRQVSELAESKIKLTNSCNYQGPASKISGQKPDKGHFSQHEYVVPSRSIADTLLETYWSEVHPLLPLIHRPSFQAQYDVIWEKGARLGTQMFQCILNAIFALSSPLVSPLTSSQEERESTSSTYFERSKQLLQFDIMDRGTFETVQALLLLGQYLQSVNKPSQGWGVLGLAVRIAQRLQIDHNGANSTSSSQYEREMFRRVWHACALMDGSVERTPRLPFLCN